MPSNWGKWGAEDQRGTLNYIDRAKVVRAAQLVKSGRVFPLAIPLAPNGPTWPGRHENWHVATYSNAHGAGPGGAEDILMIHTHGSTHLDALCHYYVDGEMYNGVKAADVLDGRGARKHAITNVGGIVTRGVLLDVARHWGVDALAAEDVIGPDELEALAAAKGVQFEAGDAVLIRTGWMTRWDGDQRAFHAQQPGINLAAAEWAGEQEIALLCSDNSALEWFPVKDDFLPVHREFLRNQGGYLLEMLNLEAIAAAGVYEFLFMLAPLNIKLGLGSPVTPLAIA